MLEVIEKLLILQERDGRVSQLEAELATIGPQRQLMLSKAGTASADLEASRLKLKHLESDRKKLELEVDARKQLIEKYALQQYQTKKNEEYRALAHEIETCKAEIIKLEDQELELMIQAESTQQAVLDAKTAAEAIQREADRQLADLAERESNLQKHLAELMVGRERLAAAVEDGTLPRYERLTKSKGGRVVVGVDHGACGGCHMKLPAQVVLGCRAEQEVVSCPNCGRILYFTRDMDMVVAE